MKRFENAKINDKVYSRMYGIGIITYIYCNWVKVAFYDGHIISFTLEGKQFSHDSEPILFYSDGINNYLTERPEPKIEINWKEWEGKEIEVSKNNIDWHKRIFVKFFPEKEYPYLCEDEYSQNNYHPWKYARIIEEKDPEIDWANVPEGTEIEVYYESDNEWHPKIFYAYTPGKEYPIQTKKNEWLDLQTWKKARLINE